MAEEGREVAARSRLVDSGFGSVVPSQIALRRCGWIPYKGSWFRFFRSGSRQDFCHSRLSLRESSATFAERKAAIFQNGTCFAVETYDIVMLIVLVSAGVFGAVKGFAWQLASIASIVLSYFVAYRFREPLSNSIVAEPPWDRFLAMLILFVGTSLVVWVGFNMVRNTIDKMRLKEFDRQIGALFGLFKGGLYCALITLFSVTLMGDTVRGKIVASKSGRFIARNLDRSESVIPPEIHKFVRPYLDRFDTQFAEAAAGQTAGQASGPMPESFGFPGQAGGGASDGQIDARQFLSGAAQEALQQQFGGNSAPAQSAGWRQ